MRIHLLYGLIRVPVLPLTGTGAVTATDTDHPTTTEATEATEAIEAMEATDMAATASTATTAGSYITDQLHHESRPTRSPQLPSPHTAPSDG